MIKILSKGHTKGSKKKDRKDCSEELNGWDRKKENPPPRRVFEKLEEGKGSLHLPNSFYGQAKRMWSEDGIFKLRERKMGGPCDEAEPKRSGRKIWLRGIHD